MAEQWESLQVYGQAMRAFAAIPEGEGPFPGVVVIQHRSDGVDTFVQEMTRRVAEGGYFAIAPELFHRRDPSDDPHASFITDGILDNELIAEVNATVDFLRNNSVVLSDSIGILGSRRGGRIVYIMAAVNPSFKAAVAYYGGRTKEAWGEGPTPFERLANTYCPVLGLFGEDDLDPSPKLMREIDAELTRHGKPHEFHTFPGAGHGFMEFTNPDLYREHAAQASWPIAMAFLEKHLGKGPTVR